MTGDILSGVLNSAEVDSAIMLPCIARETQRLQVPYGISAAFGKRDYMILRQLNVSRSAAETPIAESRNQLSPLFNGKRNDHHLRLARSAPSLLNTPHCGIVFGAFASRCNNILLLALSVLAMPAISLRISFGAV